MKKNTGPSFFKRVRNLFRDEEDDSSTYDGDTTVSNDTKPEQRPKDKHHSNDPPVHAWRSTKGRPSDKARESNIDRYKHPSDLHRPGY